MPGNVCSRCLVLGSQSNVICHYLSWWPPGMCKKSSRCACFVRVLCHRAAERDSAQATGAAQVAATALIAPPAVPASPVLLRPSQPKRCPGLFSPSRTQKVSGASQARELGRKNDSRNRRRYLSSHHVFPFSVVPSASFKMEMDQLSYFKI